MQKYLLLFRDTLIGYECWSYSILFLQYMFYYPLVEMRLIGNEYLLPIPLIAIVIRFKFFQKILIKYQHSLFIYSSICLVLSRYLFNAFQVLVLLSIGFAIHSFSVFGGWYVFHIDGDRFRKWSSIYGLLIGLVLNMIMKMAFYSLDPIHENTKFQLIALFLITVTCKLTKIEESKYEETKKQIKNEDSGSHWIIHSIGLACVMFTLPWLFGGHGVIPRWIDLPPFPFGVIIILSSSLGIAISNFKYVSSFLYFSMVAIPGSVLLSFGEYGYPSFVGGVLISIYVFSVSFLIIDQSIQSKNIAKILFFSRIFTNILDVASIYVVAYPFVPYGEILREKPHYILFFVIGGIGITTLFSNFKKSIEFKRIITILIFILLLILLPVSIYRVQKSKIRQPYEPKEIIRTFNWAIHFGYDNSGKDSFSQMRDMLIKHKADVIGMVETDLSRLLIGNRDIIEYLSNELQMYSDFGSPTRDSTWGCGLLSVYPIIESKRRILPSPEGELACLIHATILVNDTKVDVIVSHFGNTQHTKDLALQTAALRDIFIQTRKTVGKLIFLGYLTTYSTEERFKQLVNSETGIQDPVKVEEEDPRYCLYTLYRDLKFVDFEYIKEGRYISDTSGQVGKFKL